MVAEVVNDGRDGKGSSQAFVQRFSCRVFTFRVTCSSPGRRSSSTRWMASPRGAGGHAIFSRNDKATLGTVKSAARGKHVRTPPLDRLPRDGGGGCFNLDLPPTARQNGSRQRKTRGSAVFPRRPWLSHDPCKEGAHGARPCPPPPRLNRPPVLGRAVPPATWVFRIVWDETRKSRVEEARPPTLEVAQEEDAPPQA